MYSQFMGFRENLKQELSYNDMLVKELAESSGVHKRALDTYLREKASMPPADAAVSIARALGVSVEYLVRDADPESKRPQASLSREGRMIIRQLEKLNPEQCKAILSLLRAYKAQTAL